MLTSIEIAKRFEKAKFSKPQSEVMATVFKELVNEERGDIVTKDLFQAELKALRSEMAEGFARQDGKIDSRFSEQDGKIDGLRADMKGKIDGLRADIDKLGLQLTVRMVGVMAGVLAIFKFVLGGF